MCQQEHFFGSHRKTNWIFLLGTLVLVLFVSQRYIQNFESNWKNSV